MCGSTRAVTWNTLDRFVSRTESHSSRDILASDRSRVIPALLTRTSTLPQRSTTLAIAVVDGLRIADVATDGERLASGSRDLGGDVVGVRLVIVSDVVGVIADRHASRRVVPARERSPGRCRVIRP